MGELLKNYIHNDAIASQLGGAAQPSTASSFINSITKRSKPSVSANAPISTSGGKGGKQKNEIFVDIVERLTILFTANGSVVNSSIDGSIQMKSYLSGNPELSLALNEDLVIGKGGNWGSVILDDCNFHECVRLDQFESQRILKFLPPEGEFSLVNYRITADYRPPFKIYPNLEEVGPQKN